VAKKDADPSGGEQGGAGAKGSCIPHRARARWRPRLDLLQNAIRNSSNERDNFRRSILVCTLLMSAKQPDIALSILESLAEKIQLYHLDKWDPDLAVEAWSIMV